MDFASDLRQVVHGANPPDHTAAHHDSTYRRCGERDSTAGVRPTGECVIRHEVADVAHIPESRVRACRTAQEVH